MTKSDTKTVIYSVIFSGGIGKYLWPASRSMNPNQFHDYATEHTLLCEIQSTYIPIGTKHRLSNQGHILWNVIEDQSGSYLGEEDIGRFDDIYDSQ